MKLHLEILYIINKKSHLGCSQRQTAVFWRKTIGLSVTAVHTVWRKICIMLFAVLVSNVSSALTVYSVYFKVQTCNLCLLPA